MEQQERIKAELEEELRKKKAKEEHGNRLADEAKRAADEKRKEAKGGNTNKRTVTKPVNKKFQRNNVNQSTADVNQFDSNADFGAAPAVEFRTNSPPVPAAAKKLNGGGGGGGGGGAKTPAKKSMNSEFNSPRPPSRSKQSEIPADYFVTESRLNVNSPVSLVLDFILNNLVC